MKNIPANVFEFWRNVRVENPDDPDSCWVWTGPLHTNGYGIYRTIYAMQAAAIIYTGSICTRIRRPKIPAGQKFNDNGHCNNRLCVRKDHFPLPVWKVQKYKIRSQPIIIKQVLDSRGRGGYTLKEIANKLHLSTKTVKRILNKAPLYDLMDDVQRYTKNRQPVPILPDTRRLEKVS